MTTRPVTTPVHVVAEAGGERVAHFVLAHGADPVRELARLGWSAQQLQSAALGHDGALTLRYAVLGAAPAPGATRAVPTDPDLVLAAGEAAKPYQRTAAYAVVTSERGVLLTELSAATSSPGRWTLPGGGLEPGEEPHEGLHREVWEESGQLIEQVELREVQTSHWIGRAPSGRLEDFHAVRIVYAAWCPDPTDPVVHDVGGSTSSVRWVPLAQIDRYPLGRSFGPLLRRLQEQG